MLVCQDRAPILGLDAWTHPQTGHELTEQDSAKFSEPWIKAPRCVCSARKTDAPEEKRSGRDVRTTALRAQVKTCRTYHRSRH